MHYLIGIIAAVVIIASVFLAMEEQKQWSSFYASHECKKVGEIAPSTSWGYRMGYNGKYEYGSIHNPGKTGYACNDGVTYWR